MLTTPYCRGFSLVEMIIYLAILILVLVVGVSVMLSLREPLEVYRAHQILYRTGDTVLTRLATEMRNASSVDVAASTLEASPGTLVLETDAGVRQFTLVSGDLQYSESSTYLGDLNGAAVTVDSLVFSHLVGSSTELVRSTITLTATIGDTAKTATFYLATVLRDSYE